MARNTKRVSGNLGQLRPEVVAAIRHIVDSIPPEEKAKQQEAFDRDMLKILNAGHFGEAGRELARKYEKGGAKH